jgi:hypothetical protein
LFEFCPRPTNWLITGLSTLALIAGDGTSRPSGLPLFSEVAELSGIHFRHEASHTSQKYMIEPMAAGIAWFDYDSDGLVDLFCVNGAVIPDPMPKGNLPDKTDPRYWNRLYRNMGQGRFEDVTKQAGLQGRGYGMGVAVGDYDNDGNTDLYITNFGFNLLYRNRGDRSFEDVTGPAGVEGSGWSSGAAFLDYDRDGRLDLFAARYAEWDFEHNPWCGPERKKIRGYCHPNAFGSVTHRLYHNEGGGKFRDVSDGSGIAKRPGKGLGVAINDYDRDGWLDILVANDSVAEQLFHNNKDGTFSEVGLTAGVAYNSNGQAFAGMGTDFDDYDNDGWPDVLLNALSLQGYVLFRNVKGDFEDVSEQVGITRVTMPHSGWGMGLIDYDNDGWKDIFVGQGHVLDTISVDYPQIPYKQKLLLLRNINGKFIDASAHGGPVFQESMAARGVAFADYDNNGTLDAAVNVNDGSALLLRNNGGTNHWILIDTLGLTANRDGIGAQIRLVGKSGLEQHRVISPASSYLSGNDKRAHFGLGRDAEIELIEIKWPSGKSQRLENVKANRILTVEEPP